MDGNGDGRGIVERSGQPHVEDGRGDGPRRLAGETVLAHDDLPVLQLHAQVGAGVRDGQDHAARLHHAGKDPHHRLTLAVEGQVARSQDEIPDARSGKVHIGGHERAERGKMLRDDLVHGLGDGRRQRMRPGGEGGQLGAQGFRGRVLGQAMAEEGHGFRVARKGPVRQRHDPGADVAHGGHAERPAQLGGTPPGIEGRDHVNGVAGVAGQFRRHRGQRRAAAEKEDAGARVRRNHRALPCRGSGTAARRPCPSVPCTGRRPAWRNRTAQAAVRRGFYAAPPPA